MVLNQIPDLRPSTPPALSLVPEQRIPKTARSLARLGQLLRDQSKIGLDSTLFDKYLRGSQIQADLATIQQNTLSGFQKEASERRKRQKAEGRYRQYGKGGLLSAGGLRDAVRKRQLGDQEKADRRTKKARSQSNLDENLEREVEEETESFPKQIESYLGNYLLE